MTSTASGTCTPNPDVVDTTKQYDIQWGRFGRIIIVGGYFVAKSTQSGNLKAFGLPFAALTRGNPVVMVNNDPKWADVGQNGAQLNIIDTVANTVYRFMFCYIAK